MFTPNSVSNLCSSKSKPIWLSCICPTTVLAGRIAATTIAAYFTPRNLTRKHTGCCTECSVVQRYSTASSESARCDSFLQKGNYSSCIAWTVRVCFCMFLLAYCSLCVTEDTDQW